MVPLALLLLLREKIKKTTKRAYAIILIFFCDTMIYMSYPLIYFPLSSLATLYYNCLIFILVCLIKFTIFLFLILTISLLLSILSFICKYPINLTHYIQFFFIYVENRDLNGCDSRVVANYQ